MRFTDFKHWHRDRIRHIRHQQHNPFLAMLDSRFWATHGEPFAKTDRGHARRMERRFVTHMKHQVTETRRV